jgi:hypothetical protein
MALALRADHFRKGTEPEVRIAKGYVRFSTGSRVSSCAACAGARSIDEIPDGVRVLSGNDRDDPGPLASSTARLHALIRARLAG